MDVVTDRLFRHLAWANNYVFDTIAEQPDDYLKLAAPNDTWTVAEILEHLTASRYADLLDGTGDIPTQVPRYLHSRSCHIALIFAFANLLNTLWALLNSSVEKKLSAEIAKRY